MKKLFYVRHGVTQLNVDGRMSGQTETQLTEEGRQQATTSGRKLNDGMPRIDYIVCSPYGRTQETAKLIAAEIGFPIDKIEFNPLFIERSFGVLEATSLEEFYEEHERKDLDDVEGAESIEVLQERAAKAFEYVKTIEADNVLVVGHGSFGRCFRRVVNNLPHTDEYDKEFHTIDNAEIIELI